MRTFKDEGENYVGHLGKDVPDSGHGKLEACHIAFMVYTMNITTFTMTEA